jgi:hypothetical protein
LFLNGMFAYNLETIFFSFALSPKNLTNMNFCLISDTECCWLNLVEWATKNFKGNRFRMAICKLAWWAEEQIVKDIRKDVKGIMKSLSKVQGSVNRIWCCRLGVNPVALSNGQKSQLGSLRHLLSISCSK